MDSLKEVHPSIAGYFNPRLNRGKLSRQVAASSELSYWWKCPRGPDHEWLATIATRLEKAPEWCPCCAGLQTSRTNSLASVAPKAAAQWHYDLNGFSAGPEEVLASSQASVWWRCPEGEDHVWAATIASRTKGATSATSLAAGPPSALALSSTTKAGAQLPPSPLREAAASASRATLNSVAPLSPPLPPASKGKENSRMVAAPSFIIATTSSSNAALARQSGNTDGCRGGGSNSGSSDVSDGCPCCTGLKVSVTNSVESLYPAVAALWHPNRNTTTPNGDLPVAASPLSSAAAEASARQAAPSGHERRASLPGPTPSSLLVSQSLVPPRRNSTTYIGPASFASSSPAASLLLLPNEVMASSRAPCVLRCFPGKGGHATVFDSVQKACTQAAAAAREASVAAAAAADTDELDKSVGGSGEKKCFFVCRGCALLSARHVIDLVVAAAVSKAEKREANRGNPFGADSKLVDGGGGDTPQPTPKGKTGRKVPQASPTARSSKWWRTTTVRGKAAAAFAAPAAVQHPYAPTQVDTKHQEGDGTARGLNGKPVKSEACTIC